MAFLEVSGAVAFWWVRDEVHPVIMTMWQHLCTYTLYFLQYRAGQHTEAQIRTAQNHAFTFAELAQEHLKGKLLTLLLHRGVSHIPAQALELGPTAWYNEAWGERDVRRAKGKGTNHASRRPAQSAANRSLLELALELCKVEQPDIGAPMSKSERQDAAGHGTRDVADRHGVCLLEALKDGNQGVEGDEVCNRAVMRVHVVFMCMHTPR